MKSGVNLASCGRAGNVLVVIAALGAVTGGVLAYTPAWAETECPAGNPVVSCAYAGSSPRVRTEHVDGRRVRVLVPPGYDSSAARYPVVYLLHGGTFDADSWLVATDIIDFTASRPMDRRAIVVMPDGNALDLWLDWRNGAFRDDTLFASRIVPYIDARYRTIPDRGHRAIAGFSVGGGGATHLAALHPDLFAAVGSFSGGTDLGDPHDPFSVAYTGLGGAAVPAAQGDEPDKTDPFGPMGNPVTDEVWWRDANASDLPGNFRGLSVSVFTGNNVPCDAQDVVTLATFTPFSEQDALAAERQSAVFHAALTRAHVPHSYDDYGCGIHSNRYVERDLHWWWDPMFQAFGRRPPASFDYRRADPRFSVWGWGFTADPKRAAEFLDIRGASDSGVTLTGSGTEAVTTGGYFAPRASVALTGAREPTVIADSDGRISFTADLAAPHTNQQYTLQAQLRGQDQPGYFSTRQVTFTPTKSAPGQGAGPNGAQRCPRAHHPRRGRPRHPHASHAHARRPTTRRHHNARPCPHNTRHRRHAQRHPQAKRP
jgi:S-formylglutathione hydrolase FrmB